MDLQDFQQRAAALDSLLGDRLGLRGGGLGPRLARAARRLPRAERRAAREIVAAARRVGHPRLARLNDPARLDRAFDRLTRHLRGIDPAERRRHALLSLLAVVVVNVMLLGLAVAAFLVWRGLI